MEYKVSVLIVALSFGLNGGLALSASDLLSSEAQTLFLSDLLNVTLDKIDDVVSKFAFTTKVNTSDIEIIQYKPDNTSISVRLSALEGVSKIEVDVNQEIVIIIHGYFSSGSESWVKSMAEAYHKVGTTNTLAVNWKDIASRNYFASAQATKKVGELVADWILNNAVKSNTDILDKIHLVGHSLGAHVSGFIGKTINELTLGQKIGRISGLDPAGPLFEFPIEKSSDHRLSGSDATLVEAYHTNKGFVGYVYPLAQQDFYVNNGGPVQPGCSLPPCSHVFSHELFTNIIGSDKLVSEKCDFKLVDIGNKTCSSGIRVIAGENNNGTNISGVFYLSTT